MKGILFILLLTFLAMQVQAQKKRNTTQQESNDFSGQYYQIQHRVLTHAIEYGDSPTAIAAIFNILAVMPGDTAIKDTLAMLYYNQNAFEQALRLGKEIIDNTPGDKPAILEIVAGSEQNLGLIKEALVSYEKLYGLSKDVGHAYIISTLQYALKRYGECNLTLDIILKEASDKSIRVNSGNGQMQLVPVNAAAYNIKGVVAVDMNQKELAMEYFLKALEIFPKFLLAASNFEQVKK